MIGWQLVNDLIDVIIRLCREYLILGEWKINYFFEDGIYIFLKFVIRK